MCVYTQYFPELCDFSNIILFDKKGNIILQEMYDVACVM